MKLLNSLIKKIKSNRKTGIVIAAAVIILMILGIFIIKGDISKKTINEKTDGADVATATEFIPEDEIPDLSNKQLSQSDGKDSSFYRPDDGTMVVLNYGTGDMDFTDAVVDWCFGEPMIDLNKFAEIAGYTVSRSMPKGFNSLKYNEVFSEGEDPDLDGFIALWLITDDGRIYKYISGSRIAYDNDGNFYNSPVCTEKLSDSNMSVPADLLPLASFEETPYHTISYDYSDGRVTVTLDEAKAADETSDYVEDDELIEDVENTVSNSEAEETFTESIEDAAEETTNGNLVEQTE